MRSHEGLQILRSDVQFRLDVDTGYKGFGGILCRDKWPATCMLKVRDVAHSERDDIAPTERVITWYIVCANFENWPSGA